LIIIGATIYASIDLRDNSRQWLVVPGLALPTTRFERIDGVAQMGNAASGSSALSLREFW
jgi:hypothetical protein